jgi:hypothetical protein
MDHQSVFFQRKCELQFSQEKIPVKIEITEGGDLKTTVLDNPSSPLRNGIHSEISGQTDAGEKIILKNISCHSDHLSTIIHANSMEVFRQNGWSTRGSEVSVTADHLGLQYKYPPEHSNPNDRIELIKRNNTPAGGGNRADWSVVLKPLYDYYDRIEYIQNHHNLVRTTRTESTVSGIYGDSRRVVDFVSDRINELSWLLSYIQGTLPSATVFRISEGSQLAYARFNQIHSNIGSSCSQGHLLFRTPSEIPLYLDRAYENYLDQRQSLRLDEVIGYYIDALNTRRAIQPRFVNLCIAIEMIADKYEDDLGSTEKQIQFLIDDLDIKFRDLLRPDASYPTEYLPSLYHEHQRNLTERRNFSSPTTLRILQDALPSPEMKVAEYFWYRSRNQVIHGGSKLSQRQIMVDYELLIVLLRRILRDVLLQNDTESLHGLLEFEPREFNAY